MDYKKLYTEEIAAAEKKVLIRAFEDHHKHVCNTAKALGFDRKTFYNRCKKLGIKIDALRIGFVK